MVKDLDKLRELCFQELDLRSYSERYKLKFSKQCELLEQWMADHGLTEFNEDIAKQYCFEKLGSFLIKNDWPQCNKFMLRAIRMLLSFQKTGDFEFRSPESDHTLIGPMAPSGNEFIEALRQKGRSASTIYSKQFHLYRFCQFTSGKDGLPSSLTVDDIDTFLKSDVVIKSDLAGFSLTMRQFLRFLHEKHYLENDLSVFIPSVPRNRGNKLPTTYTDEEVQRLLDSVEKGSAVGKRDYLILLLASEYGLRASDIRTLAFKEIDWDLSLIDHKIMKTGKPLQLPLLADVGNAIYDYLSNGRPESKCPFIVVSHNLETRGKPITSPTLHSIVSQYMSQAQIKDWQQKRHGTHALRHSLAVRMLG